MMVRFMIASLPTDSELRAALIVQLAWGRSNPAARIGADKEAPLMAFETDDQKEIISSYMRAEGIPQVPSEEPPPSFLTPEGEPMDEDAVIDLMEARVLGKIRKLKEACLEYEREQAAKKAREEGEDDDDDDDDDDAEGNYEYLYRP